MDRCRNAGKHDPVVSVQQYSFTSGDRRTFFPIFGRSSFRGARDRLYLRHRTLILFTSPCILVVGELHGVQ